MILKRLRYTYLATATFLLFEGEGAGGGAPAAAAPAADAAAAAAAAPAAAPAAPSATALSAAMDAAAKPAGETAKPAAQATAEYVDDPNKTPEENAAAKAAFDADKAKAAKPPEKKAGEEEKPIDPATYKIDVPEGFELDKEVEGEFRGIAAEYKLSQEQLDKLKGLQIKLYEKQAQNLADTIGEWGKQTKADPELGGEQHDAKMAKAGAFLNEFFEPSVKKLLDKTGIGNHPDIVRGFYRAGLAMSEMPTFRHNAGATSRESIASVLYGGKSA